MCYRKNDYPVDVLFPKPFILACIVVSVMILIFWPSIMGLISVIALVGTFVLAVVICFYVIHGILQIISFLRRK